MIPSRKMARGVATATRARFIESWKYYFRLSRRLTFLSCVSLCFPLQCFAAESASDSVAFFENKIRPLLADHCYQCHSAQAEKLKGGLQLDSREAVLKGGESGAVVVPGNPGASLLMTAVRYMDKDLQMPPKGKKLSERQIADLAEWVRLGVPWPAGDKIAPSRTATSGFEVSDKDRAYWAFQPIRRPAPPIKKSRSKIDNPIDAFVFAELERKGLEPNPPAARRELIRRVYFDLIGLPPSPEEVFAFESDTSPDAYDRLIERLLALPQYGERWGRHWLDVVRFAQSNGYERDGEKPLAWRYRDYVIKSFNEDKPYDRFILEQLAGDELTTPTRDSIIATGFHRLGVWDDEPDDKRMAEFEELDDILSTTGAAFLGLTLGCARCHDHKFDPIPQSDYYQLLAFIRNIRLNEAPSYTLDSANYTPLAEPETVRQWHAGQQVKVKALEEALAVASTDGDKKKLQQQLKEVKAEIGPFEWALAARERGPKLEPTHILIRGNAASPGAEVQPAFLTVLGGQKPALPPASSNAPSAVRRLALAEWIARPENPLTARVMANRIWEHHFGKGIVKTTTDFGHAGMPPTAPKLLDWLAAEFIDNGWSVKRLHKAILLSSTYRMSSRAGNAKALAVDPGNDLLWRQNLRRLEAEAIRDEALAISGKLNLKMGGRGFFPHLAGEVIAGGSRPGLDWEISSDAEQSRRSVYTYLRRTSLVPVLDTFDYSNTTSPLGERPVTTVAPQALMLLNDDFIQQQAAAFAARLKREAGDLPENQIRRGYQLALGRGPDALESQTALNFLSRQARGFGALRSRLTFRPDAPNSLATGYLDLMQPEQFLIGPRGDWRYHRGRWPGTYEGIRTMDRTRGPFALWTGVRFTNGTLEAKLTLHNASEFASILFRATTAGDEQRGYEIVFDPRQQRVSLRRHDAELSTLAQASAAIPTGERIPVKIAGEDSRLRVWVNGADSPLLDMRDAKPILEAGCVGVRASGAAVSLDDLIVSTANGSAAIVPASKVGDDGISPPNHRALESFCLLLLNLNEVVYVE